MIDVDKIVNEQAVKLENATEEQKQDFIEIVTAFGNFFNCLCKQSERRENGENRMDAKMRTEN